jgi:hypothetical protein
VLKVAHKIPMQMVIETRTYLKFIS